MLKSCDTFFQDSLMNKKLNKNSICLKYNFCNNTVQKLEVSIFVETSFMQGFWINAVLFNFLFINEPQKNIAWWA